MTTTTTTPTTTPAPQCPEWCSKHTLAHLDEPPVWIHRHPVSDPDASYSVMVEQVQGEPAAVYVEDPHGDVLTADEARAFAAALVTAAGLVEFWQE